MKRSLLSTSRKIATFCSGRKRFLFSSPLSFEEISLFQANFLNYLPHIYFTPFHVLTQNVFPNILLISLRSIWTHWREETSVSTLISLVSPPALWSECLSRQEKNNKLASQVETPKKMKETNTIKCFLRVSLNKGINTL